MAVAPAVGSGVNPPLASATVFGYISGRRP